MHYTHMHIPRRRFARPLAPGACEVAARGPSRRSSRPSRMHRSDSPARHPNCDQVLTPKGMGYRCDRREVVAAPGEGSSVCVRVGPSATLTRGQKPHTKGCDAAEGLRDDLAGPFGSSLTSPLAVGKRSPFAALVDTGPLTVSTGKGVSHSASPTGSSMMASPTGSRNLWEGNS